jgi:hypothetical protein
LNLLELLAAFAFGCGSGTKSGSDLTPGNCMPRDTTIALGDGATVVCRCVNCDPGCTGCTCTHPDGGVCP